MAADDPYQALKDAQAVVDRITAVMGELREAVTTAHEARADLLAAVAEAKAEIRSCASEEARRHLRKALAKAAEAFSGRT